MDKDQERAAMADEPYPSPRIPLAPKTIHDTYDPPYGREANPTENCKTLAKPPATSHKGTGNHTHPTSVTPTESVTKGPLLRTEHKETNANWQTNNTDNPTTVTRSTYSATIIPLSPTYPHHDRQWKPPPPTPTAHTSNLPHTSQTLEPTTREPPTKVTSIQSARISITNSPAAAALKSRMRRQRSANDEDDQELQAVNDLVGPTLAPTITSIEIPVEAIQPPPTTPSPRVPIVHYPSSEPSHSPPSYALPPIPAEDSPTPPATPTRFPWTTPSAPPLSTPDMDIPMAFTQLTPQEAPRRREQGTPPNDTAEAGRTTPSVRGIVEADCSDPHVGRSNLRTILDKFTPGPMPHVQDTHPTSIFEYLDLDLISDWENFQRGKLIAIPFDNEARTVNMHEDIKARLMAAIADISVGEVWSQTDPNRV
ncbi:hypothetical protein EDB85DRAFT_1902117 [Lactarius pseudohatsudake]|nr:hypothetical protein EDB85DRAFT_1902117 [Lactarius pseudohatsudake]